MDKESRNTVHQSVFEALKTLSTEVLERFHQANPLKAGISKEELKSKFPRQASGKLFTQVLNRMIKEQQLALEDDTVRLATHTVSLQVDQKALQQQILDRYRQSRLTPPYFREIVKALDVNEKTAKEVLALLVKEETLVKVKEDLYYDHQAIEKLKAELVHVLTEKGEISTPEFKDMTGASRKYVIPLIEYFDATNLTIRVGDTRRLRKTPIEPRAAVSGAKRATTAERSKHGKRLGQRQRIQLQSICHTAHHRWNHYHHHHPVGP